MQRDDETLSRVERARDEAADFAVRMARAQRPDARFECSDGTGAVAAVVDGEGRVIDVLLHRDWRARVGVDGLGAALQEAVGQATSARLEDFAVTVGEELDRPAPRSAGTHRVTEAVRARLAQAHGGTGRDHPLDPGEILELLETIESSLDTLSGQFEVALNRRHTGRSRARHVAAILTGGGALVGVEFDKRWLVNAHEVNIRRETREALQAAYQAAGQDTVRNLMHSSRLGSALGNPADDPFTLIQELGRLAEN